LSHKRTKLKGLSFPIYFARISLEILGKEMTKYRPQIDKLSDHLMVKNWHLDFEKGKERQKQNQFSQKQSVGL